MKLVSVFTGWNTEEAQMVRSRLEAAQFHPVVANEHSGVDMLGGFGGGNGGILVQVPEDEADDAKEFLASEEPPAE